MRRVVIVASVLFRCTASVTFVAWCTCTCTCTHARVARAEAPVVGGRTPRGIGRAGVGTISDDGSGALLGNPAAIARRSSTRIQIGLAFVDDEMYWLHSQSSPAGRDQSSSRILPSVAIEGAIGEWIVGIGVGTSARSERLFRDPNPIDTPPDRYGNMFEYRYTGLAGAFRRDAVTASAAYRLTDTLALGVSLSTSRVAISETRRVWAGDVNRIVLGVPRPDRLGDPAHDVTVDMSATDNFTPSVVAGVLLAPEDSRIELGGSASWSAPARVDGTIDAVGQVPATSASLSSPTARLEVEQPISVRTGVRWLGERVIAEVGGDLFWFPRRAQETTWQITGVTITDMTTPTVPEQVELVSVPSRISSRTHGALRAAFDVELIAGFLWATTGYAFTTAGTSHARLSPTFGDLGGHTFALGLEATTAGFTVSVGWGRTWSVKQPEPVSRWRLDNPFGSGDGEVPSGTFDGSTDMIGVAIDADFDAE